MDMAKEGEDFTQLPGIGKDLAAKIEEIIKTGKLLALEKLEKQMPPGILTLMQVQGLGAKRVKALCAKLKISTIDDLQKAASAQKVRRLAGFGIKTEENILKEIERLKGAEGKLRLDQAEEIGLPLVEYLRGVKGVKKSIISGSLRRAKETVRDLDILVSAARGKEVSSHFIGYADVAKVVSHGQTRSTVILRSGVQVDLRVVPEKSYGAALLYFTGSKAHNIKIRKLAIKKGLKVNEYGVFRVQGTDKDKWVAGNTEEEVYNQLGLAYIAPELREDWGEVEAASRGRLPHLVNLEDIRGDLHTHTELTDGQNSLEEMAEAARKRGYDYIAITEHSQHVTVAHGLNAKELLKWIKEIDRFNASTKGIRVLKGIEVDILEDGSLDLEESILKELDLTVCAIHSKFNLSAARQTERIRRAMDNPCFNILAHPTGRLINERNPYEINMEEVMHCAKERDCVLEQNAHPMRLDLNDNHCKLAKEMGVKVAISTDAHSVVGLDAMRFGVLQARRGWLEPGNVINTMSLARLKNLLKRR